MAGGSLDHGDRAGKSCSDRTELEDLFGLPAEELEHRVEEGAQNLAQKRGVVSEKVSERRGQAENPMSNGRVSEDVLDQERGAITHPTTETRWTERTPLTTEGHESVKSAALAMNTGEAFA
jgi:hypothetical protein